MTATTWPDALFMVGCGNMAGRMLSRWLDCGLDPARVTVLRPSGRLVADGVRVVTDYPAVLGQRTTVLLGMKPYQIGTVTDALSPLVGPDMRVISILAGTRLSELQMRFPRAGGIVRAMPNLPVGLGQGVTALFADNALSADDRAAVDALIRPLGLAEWVEDEPLFNRLTALSGCGPAFLFRFVDALARAGEEIGIPPDQAARMALATVQGAAAMAADAADPPATLADRVASPGGMTREGLNILDAENRLVALLTDTLVAARDRGDAMARESQAN